jgi:hypothetical protein
VLQLQDGWERQKDFQRNWDNAVKQTTEKVEERHQRYRRLLDLEMNRRWQQQAGQSEQRY